MHCQALDAGRITIGAISVGLAQRALDESISYSLTREQFKKKIFEFQGLQFMMSDMATEVEASRLLVYHACELLDQGNPNPKDIFNGRTESQRYSDERDN